MPEMRKSSPFSEMKKVQNMSGASKERFSNIGNYTSYSRLKSAKKVSALNIHSQGKKTRQPLNFLTLRKIV